MLRDAMLDTARRVVSARRVVQYQNEIGVLAHLWYNALTTGLGTQTLGEEYRDLFQMDPRGAAPGAARRWALVFLDAFAEPAMRRVRARAREPPPTAGRETTARETPPRATPRRRVDVVVGVFSRSHRTRASALRVVRGDRARCRVRAVFRPRAPRDRRPDARALVRGHRALFFVTGFYFSFARRAAGVRYAFVGAEGPEGGRGSRRWGTC